MTPLDRLAEVIARMTEGPWSEEVIGSALRYFRKCGPQVSDLEGYRPAWRWPHEDDAVGIAALRNVADALIAVARAAKATKIRCRCTDYKSCEECVLVNARDALDAAIVKALGEGK